MTEAQGVEVPVTQSVWRVDTAGGHEEPVAVPGLTSGTSVAGSQLSAWRDLAPPPPPDDVPLTPERSTFEVRSLSGSSFQFYWTTPGAPLEWPITGYYVYLDGQVAHDVQSEGAVVTARVQNNTGHRMTVLFSGLQAGTIYSIQVQAISDAGNSNLSEPYLVTTLEAPVNNAPNAPTSFRVTSIGTTVANVAWSAATLPAGATAVTGYRIYTGGTTLLASPGASATSTQLTGLQPGTPYTLTIKAVNAAGESAASAVVPVTTQSEVAAPTAPTGLRVTAVGDGFVSLAWNANASAEAVDGYRLYRGTALVYQGTLTSYTNSGLTNGVAVTYTVRAYRGTLVSAASAPTAPATPTAPTTLPVPTAPTGLTAVGGDTVVDLNWNASPATQEVTHYRVHVDGAFHSGGMATPFARITGLSNNRAYSFQVMAVNATGQGALSTAVPGTPRSSTSTTSTLPYSADSFFKSRVDGPNVPIDATRSTAFRNFMNTFMGTPNSPSKQAEVKHVRLNIDPSWAMTYHISKASDPIWKITEGTMPDGSRAVFTSEVNILKTQGFHMSDDKARTFPTGDQDRPAVIRDGVYGYTAQFADAEPNLTTRVIRCTGPGILYHSSNGLDKRNPKSNDQRNRTSRGRIVDSMIITREDLDRAVANNTGVGHMLHLFHCETRTSDGFCHPMINAEGDKNGWGAEGERIRVKPTVNLVQRGITGAMLAVARTLQEHGGILGDNSGSVTLVKMSQPQFYTGTNITADGFAGKLLWADFEVVQRGWQ